MLATDCRCKAWIHSKHRAVDYRAWTCSRLADTGYNHCEVSTHSRPFGNDSRLDRKAAVAAAWIGRTAVHKIVVEIAAVSQNRTWAEVVAEAYSRVEHTDAVAVDQSVGDAEICLGIEHTGLGLAAVDVAGFAELLGSLVHRSSDPQ